MARINTTIEQWAVARLAYESDPLKSYGDIGKVLGISKQAVGRKAVADGWQKRISNEAAVERAYQAADNIKSTSSAVVVSSRPVDVDAKPNPNSDEVLDSAVDDAVAKRAAVLERHRSEVNAVRNMIYAGLKGAGDPEKAKLAKASAESLRLVQDMERKSWGFDREDNKQPPIVIIDREPRERRRYD